MSPFIQYFIRRMYEEFLGRMDDEMWKKTVQEYVSSAHPNGCKTCNNTGLAEDWGEGHGGVVFVTCPDCNTEPFPLP